MDYLEPLDPEYVSSVLSKPPFVTISGVTNARDLGGYPTRSSDQITRPRYIFRSAELAHITDEGKSQLKSLGISTVYDLRSDLEIEKYNSPLPEIEGVKILRTPVFKKEDYSPETLAKRFQLYASGKSESFKELYTQILDNGGPAYGTILRHVRDRPSEGFLFHCTAGKDRTGIIAAIILKLMGVDDSDIAQDYALTRVGREPDRQRVMERLAKEPLFASNKEAALNMFSSRAETMLELLALIEEQYGGVENYVKQIVGLSDEDISIIRRNFLVSKSAL